MDGDEERWLTPDELQTWLSYVATTTLLEAALDRQLQREASMSHAYYQILAMLSDSPRRTLRMSDLAAVTQSSQSRLSHAVARLEGNGWIRRVPCLDDRRSTLAQLTDEGFAALAEAAPGHVRTVRELMFDRLTPEQVSQLREICTAVLGGLTVEHRGKALLESIIERSGEAAGKVEHPCPGPGVS
ncbi:MarR family winged helix-turn-helix transcriptional regulator [Pseudonocardia alaniniphila]|uniref:MarR family transcriptional regulator n=1 Tax=Pseudonocardia alaniniphila TaxID=75291 RepID=A0ABS9TMJ5_9PSEU|nr:MarR family transcriptional regulator [Pseudonocardia alaniniphila]MCH6169618.1 MarR family transcriptional regulator [Pseudonocardia alaniniphila]